MSKIVLGQYLPGDSWIYKLDPRLKIILSGFLMVLIFLIPSLITIAIAFSVFLLIFISTRISILRLFKSLKPLVFLILFSSILQLIYINEGRLLYSFHFNLTLIHLFIIIAITIFYIFTKKFIRYRLTYNLLFFISIFTVQYLLRFESFMILDYNLNIFEGGLQRAGFIFLRIILMISLTTLLTLSTTPMDINIGLQSVMKPLKLIKIPVEVIAIMLSLTLRFIPTLILETDKIMKAQASRGVDFNEGKLKDKVMQIISLLVPLFVMAIKRSEDLANAMSARGFIIGAKRTRLDELRFQFIDYFVMLIFTIMFVSVLYVRFYVY